MSSLLFKFGSRKIPERFAYFIGGIGLVGGLLGACDGKEEATAADVCEDAAQAVAQRTLSCTSDVELANARFHGLLGATRCIADVNRISFQEIQNCSGRINKLTCEQVELLGDDYVAWITRAEAPIEDSGATNPVQCAAIFSTELNPVGDGGLEAGLNQAQNSEGER